MMKVNNIKKVKKVLLIIIAIIMVFLLFSFVLNILLTNIEKGKINNYGEKVSINNKNMNVLIQGDGDETIVLLPAGDRGLAEPTSF